MIESYVALLVVGFAVVALFTWWVDSRKKSFRRDEELRPLTGVVLPKKKDGNTNE